MIGYKLMDKGTCNYYYCEIRAKIITSIDSNNKLKLINAHCLTCQFYKNTED